MEIFKNKYMKASLLVSAAVGIISGAVVYCGKKAEQKRLEKYPWNKPGRVWEA